MPVLAQSRQERVDKIAQMLSNASQTNRTTYTSDQTTQTLKATPRQLMRETLTEVDYDKTPARLALEIWSTQTGVPLVVNWKKLEAEGIDTTRPISLKLRRVPADQVLKLIVQQMNPDPLGDDRLQLDIQQWYIRVITRGEALRKSTTRMYFIGDLLMDIPNFDTAPDFDLNQVLSNTSSGGSDRGGGTGGGGGEGGIFGDLEADDKEKVVTKQDRAEQVADLIRNAVEPDIWRANGGDYASVRYFRGMLVVKAPEFVHEQIGGTFNIGQEVTKQRKANPHRSANNAQTKEPVRSRRSSPGNVAGIQPQP